jgi:hypothetical protein
MLARRTADDTMGNAVPRPAPQTDLFRENGENGAAEWQDDPGPALQGRITESHVVPVASATVDIRASLRDAIADLKPDDGAEAPAYARSRPLRGLAWPTWGFRLVHDRDPFKEQASALLCLMRRLGTECIVPRRGAAPFCVGNVLEKRRRAAALHLSTVIGYSRVRAFCTRTAFRRHRCAPRSLRAATDSDDCVQRAARYTAVRLGKVGGGPRVASDRFQ